MKPVVKMEGNLAAKRMTLSQLRACIRAGAYQDDLFSLEERRLLDLALADTTRLGERVGGGR